MSKSVLSQRGREAPASPIRKLEPLARKATERGTKIYHLNIGQPDIATPEAFVKRAQLRPGEVLSYSPSAGLYPYRQALAAYYTPTSSGLAVPITESDVLVTTGGSEALLFTMFALCDAGDDPPADRVTEPAEIYVDLRPGRYDLDLRWQDDADQELGSRQQIVEVEPDTLLPLDLDLTSPLVPWTLELRGTAACTQLALEIFYADPTHDLHDLPDAADGRYRSDLVSDGGLALADPEAPLACDALVDGPQLFRDLDRGAYRLRLTVDGRACELGFIVDAAATPLSVDLAKPGCAG